MRKSRASAITFVAYLFCALSCPWSIAEPDVTVVAIQDFLLTRHDPRQNSPAAPTTGSPLMPSAAYFRDRGRIYDVDPRLVVAIAGAETSYGWQLCNNGTGGRYNAWNWFWCTTCQDPCAGSTFDHWDQGIDTVTKFLHLSYIIKGRTTIPDIGEKYCPVASCANWANDVDTIFRQISNGNSTDLRFFNKPPN